MGQEPRAYCVGNFKVTNPDLMGDYAALAVPLVHKFGGKVLASAGKVFELEGTQEPFIVVLEFPSLRKAEEFWASPEYRAIMQMRIDATTGGFVAFTEGRPPE